MEKILKVFKDLEELTGEGSQAKKQSLIVENFHEENFSYFLDVCFNPFVHLILNSQAMRSFFSFSSQFGIIVLESTSVHGQENSTFSTRANEH